MSAKKYVLGKKEQAKEEAAQGYWMYSDGSAYWGIALYRNGETPWAVPTAKEVETAFQNWNK